MSILQKNLRLLRENKWLTQTKFAAKVNLPVKRYASWEEGRAEPSIADIISIAKEHRVTIDSLLKDDLSLYPKFC